MRIENYGLIGDLQTAALVGLDGSVDWLCLPRFDSAACFAALLGDGGDGRWLLAPAGEVERVERRYREDTLVHELDFHCAGGSVRVIDFMPPRGTEPDLVRIVDVDDSAKVDAYGIVADVCAEFGDWKVQSDRGRELFNCCLDLRISQ